jgi:hypothetical protein
MHQQVSVTAREGNSVEAIERRGSRDALLPGTSIALLICGECWSNELYERATTNCRALVIAAHRNVNMHEESNGYGKLSWHRRLDAFYGERKIPTVLSEHTRVLRYDPPAIIDEHVTGHHHLMKCPGARGGAVRGGTRVGAIGRLHHVRVDHAPQGDLRLRAPAFCIRLA